MKKYIWYVNNRFLLLNFSNVRNIRNIVEPHAPANKLLKCNECKTALGESTQKCLCSLFASVLLVKTHELSFQ